MSTHSPSVMAAMLTILFAETFLGSSSWWTSNLRTGVTRRTGPPTPPWWKSRRVQLAMTSMSTCLARSTRLSASLLLILSLWLLCLMRGLPTCRSLLPLLTFQVFLLPFRNICEITVKLLCIIYNLTKSVMRVRLFCLNFDQFVYLPIRILTILRNYLVSMLNSQQEILSLVRVPIGICQN